MICVSRRLSKALEKINSDQRNGLASVKSALPLQLAVFLGRRGLTW